MNSQLINVFGNPEVYALPTGHPMAAQKVLLCNSTPKFPLTVTADELILYNFYFRGQNPYPVEIFARKLTLIGNNVIEAGGMIKIHIAQQVAGLGRLEFILPLPCQ